MSRHAEESVAPLYFPREKLVPFVALNFRRDQPINGREERALCSMGAALELEPSTAG